ncbi:hypothetical protein ACSFA0_24520 [Variovorax sp. LT1P1]|uniref:hypothetical protein n=1 Tax=Variovorax sp. LT1P1 TaxID=3443730 RepID=UPI003F478D2B
MIYLDRERYLLNEPDDAGDIPTLLSGSDDYGAWCIEVTRGTSLQRYFQIVCRQAGVIPFEPSAMSEAMVKALLAVYRTPSWSNLIGTHGVVERVATSWFLLRWLKRTFVSQVNRVRRFAGPPSQLGGGVGVGFFSAAKPNLRNAP